MASIHIYRHGQYSESVSVASLEDSDSLVAELLRDPGTTVFCAEDDYHGQDDDDGRQD